MFMHEVKPQRVHAVIYQWDSLKNMLFSEDTYR